MLRKMKKNRSVTVAGMFAGFLLFMLYALAASAADFVPLATISKGLTYPTDVAVSPSGTAYVVDGLAKRIVIFNSDYSYTGSITSVEKPTAVAVSANGNTLYVGDNVTKSVKILNAAGLVVGELKENGVMATFELPRNICLDASGNIYVVDQFSANVKVFDSSGNFAYSIGSLSMPLDAVAIGDELFIIDQPSIQTTNGSRHSSRIQIFDLVDKVFVADAQRTFPGYGTNIEEGQYLGLKGLAVDPHNTLYASDSFVDVVYKYSTDGVYLGPVNNGLATPMGVAVSSDGRLFATSSYDGAVKVMGVDYSAGAGTWANDSPVAVAGANQSVNEGANFFLDGSGSQDADGITSYSWTQTGGIPVFAVNPFETSSATLPVAAPSVGPAGATLTFELQVVDGKNKVSANAATTMVKVNNVVSGSVVINNGDLYTNDPQVTLALDSDDAVQMRLANDNAPFDNNYYDYAAAGNWLLSPGDGNKTVNVEFTDAGGNSTTAMSSITLDTEKPAVPELVGLGGVGGEFNWQPANGSAKYIFEYAANPGFAGAVTIADLNYNGVNIAMDALGSGTWYWRVRAVDAAGNMSDWSATGEFTVGPDCAEVPQAPRLAQPANGLDKISRTAILETNDMTYPAECGTHLRTEWEVSEQADFSGRLVLHLGTTLDNLTVFKVPALVLQPETTYFWRARHVASNGKQSDWSAPWSFITAADYDEAGVDGVLHVETAETPDASGAEISIKEAVGDAGIKIKVIRVSPGVVAQTIQDIDPDIIPDTINKPDSFPLGLLSFRLTVEPGTFAQVEIVFSAAAPQNAEWYVYNTKNGWHAYEGAFFSRNRKSVTLNFQDGGIGDADGVINGIIVNP